MPCRFCLPRLAPCAAFEPPAASGRARRRALDDYKRGVKTLNVYEIVGPSAVRVRRIVDAGSPEAEATLASLATAARGGDLPKAEALIACQAGPVPARWWSLLARAAAQAGDFPGAAAIPARAAAGAASSADADRLYQLVSVGVIRALGEAGQPAAAADVARAANDASAGGPHAGHSYAAVALLAAYAAAGQLSDAQAAFASLPSPRPRAAHAALAEAWVRNGRPGRGAAHLAAACAAGDMRLPWRRPDVNTAALDLHGWTGPAAAAVVAAAVASLRHGPAPWPFAAAGLPPGDGDLTRMELQVITGRGLGSKSRLCGPVRAAVETTLAALNLVSTPVAGNPGALRIRRSVLAVWRAEGDRVSPWLTMGPDDLDG